MRALRRNVPHNHAMFWLTAAVGQKHSAHRMPPIICDWHGGLPSFLRSTSMRGFNATSMQLWHCNVYLLLVYFTFCNFHWVE